MTDTNIMWAFCSVYAGLSLAKSESRILPYVFAAASVFTAALALFHNGQPL